MEQLMDSAGLEPATSRFCVDKPRPSARTADKCVARRGALPTELQAHEHSASGYDKPPA